jgi:hypothetical protein
MCTTTDLLRSVRVMAGIKLRLVSFQGLFIITKIFNTGNPSRNIQVF